jgi:diguanylate cyclase (GGDEF)-like protein
MSAIGPKRFDIDEVFNAVNLGLIVLDIDGNILLWNEWISKRSNIKAADALNHPFATVFQEPLTPGFLTATKNALTYGLPVVLSNALHHSPLPLYHASESSQPGMRMPQSIAITPIRSRLDECCCLIQVTDASTSIKREKMLRSHSEILKRETITDSLTGIYNRRFFDEHCKMALGQAKRNKLALSVFMVDIDFFKQYNDHYGHIEGDRALTLVAKTLRSQASRATDVVARYGGEEFVLVLPNLPQEKAEQFAEKLRLAVWNLAIPHSKSSAYGQLTISVGFCAGVPDNDCEIANFLDNADSALYRAKENGRNQAFSISLTESAARQLPEYW